MEKVLENKAREIGGSKWVVKAKFIKGKAGGIIVCNSPLEVAQATDKLLGKRFKIVDRFIIKMLLEKEV